jgi:apolipoprotein N-acyltransferase
VLAGVALAWAQAWPWGVAHADWTQAHQPVHLWPQAGQPWPLLSLLALASLGAWLPQVRSCKAAGLLGWAFATAWLAATFWWLYVSMHTHGGLAAPLAVAAVLALAAFLGGYWAVVFMLFQRFALHGRAFRALVFASLWTVAELARGVLFTGFPWGAAGHAHINTLAWAAPWVGVYGMGALAVAVGMFWGQTWSQSASWVSRGLALALVLAVLSGGPGAVSFTRSSGELDVLLLQGNVAQSDKFDPESGVPQALAWYGQRLAAAPAHTLVVAPETALPLLPQQLGQAFWQPLFQRLGAGQGAVLTGLPLGDHETGFANAVWGVDAEQARQAGARLDGGASPAALDAGPGAVYRYEKHHLVPFGEFVPPLFRWFVDLMHIPLGDFNRGAASQPGFEWAGQRIAPNICYEDLFGEELARSFRSPEDAPTVLVNLSNLAWFGHTVALDQHLHIARLRTLELQRPMVRATNTGATVAIDHHGVVQRALPRATTGALQARVQGREGLTPYARWAALWGLWPVGLCAAVAPALAALRSRREGGPVRRP